MKTDEKSSESVESQNEETLTPEMDTAFAGTPDGNEEY